MQKSKWLLTSTTKKAIVVEAETAQQALDENADIILIDEYERKYGNIHAYVNPKNEIEEKELLRKLIIGAGEYFEYYGWSNICTETAIKYLEDMGVKLDDLTIE